MERGCRRQATGEGRGLRAGRSGGNRLVENGVAKITLFLNLARKLSGEDNLVKFFT